MMYLRLAREASSSTAAIKQIGPVIGRKHKSAVVKGAQGHSQKWYFTDGGDTEAMNDLGSHLALTEPDQQAAHERAVIEAMHAAGIDPVMLVGFSQGGILAARMAASHPQPFAIDAIAVAGAPIDAMELLHHGGMKKLFAGAYAPQRWDRSCARSHSAMSASSTPPRGGGW